MAVSEQLVNSIMAKIISEKIGEWLSTALGEAFGKGQRRIWKPDIYLVEHFGLKVIIEAKIEHKKHRNVVEKCKERLDEGLADICFAVTYGEEVRGLKTIDELESILRRLKVRVTIILASGETYGPEDITVDELVTYMEKHRVYDHLVEKELIEEIAKRLKKALDECVNSMKPGIRRNIALIAESQLKLYGGSPIEEEEYE